MAKPDGFCHASKLLSTIPSPAFNKNKGAMKQREKLIHSIETIQSVLLDAEKKQEVSPDVKNWIERVKNEFDAADVLFSKQWTTRNPLMEVFFSYKFNPFTPNDSFSKEAKGIRKRLFQLSQEMGQFKFTKCHFEHPTIGINSDVLGRDDDKKNILGLVFDESSVDQETVSVIAIANIEGTGKTTLAQLVYNDDEVQHEFQNKWWAHISCTSDEKEVLGKIFQSITEKSYQHYSIRQLESKIRDSLSSSEKYLLVLDDVWDSNLGMWSKIMSLLSDCAKGSKVIVTTRFLSVPRAMKTHGNNFHIYELNGLSDENSWELFQMVAFTQQQKSDSTWTDLGREIVRKCSNVPLTICNTASLLSTMTSIQDWEKIAKNEKSLLKSSYDRLTPNLRRCFDYCSLFPRDHIISKEKMIYLWIAQKYVKLGNHETLEEAGNAYFMELFHIGFFQEAKVDDNGDIISCKICDGFSHPVDGVKIITMIKKRLNQFPKEIRHLSISSVIDLTWIDQAKGVRSLINLFEKPSCSLSDLDKQVTVLKSLRALDLRASNIEEVPSSIEKLIKLRYLNLSENTFRKLPDSITMLKKLISLDISYCRNLEALPNNFKNLSKLRHLDMSFCDSLWNMPPGFGELTSLVHLSDFKVSKRSGSDSEKSGLDALEGLNLRGKLTITYDYKGAWRRDEKMLKYEHIPESIRVLTISDYPSTEIDNVVMSNLQHLVLIRCKQVRCFPPLYRLPKLRILQLYHLHELECIVDEIKVDVSTTGFFGSLEKLELVDLPKLVGWLRVVKEAQSPRLEHLSHLEIKSCHQLIHMAKSPRLQRMCLEETRKELISTCLVQTLKDITINWCTEMTSFPGEGLTALRKLEIRNCTSLKELRLTPNALEEITISNCPNVELWGMDWCPFTKLNLLNVDEIPEENTLPGSFRLLRALGKPHIKKW